MSSQMRSTSIPPIRYIPLSHISTDSQASALRLILTLFPDWGTREGEVEFTRFTDGITNTLLKAVKKRPGWSEEQMDSDTVLLRAYGKGTEVLIDRERETASHSLLASYHLAPTLLARFKNGLLYRFIQGQVCTSHDLTCAPVWRGVARRLGEWHAVLPLVATAPTQDRKDTPNEDGHDLHAPRSIPGLTIDEVNAITPGKLTPNVWTVMNKWIKALPAGSEAEAKRKAVLQAELERAVEELGAVAGLGKDGLVFSHCDLLSGNVIIQPQNTRASNNSHQSPSVETVSFIDYEYATPSPAAFDLANHFAEWGGLDCEYSVLPTRSIRRAFLAEYLESYNAHLASSGATAPQPKTPSPRCNRSESPSYDDEQITSLFASVDLFRGIPGLYWGIWALIQATISQIDFDYASYAEVRLGEYWAWKAEHDGSRAKDGREACLREKRWAEE